jgi:hypothetical protein
MKKEITQSAQQTLVFFEEFVRKEKVVDFIRKYRKRLNLPPNGISFTEKHEKELSNPIDGFLYIPDEVRECLTGLDKEKPVRIVKTCNLFVMEDMGVNSVYVKTLLRLYAYFNQTIESTVEAFNTWDDLLRMEHIPSELSWFSNEDHFLLKCAYEHFASTGETHPIALYINPEASQRQIQDFLSKNWGFIEAYRKKSTGKITGLKKKSKGKQERKDFIYEHRDLPRKEIMRMANDQFPDLEHIDYGNVGKIISLEKKHREKK